MTIYTFAQAAGQALYIGLSTDTKPPPVAGQTYLTSDTGQVFSTDGITWYADPSRAIQQTVIVSADGEDGNNGIPGVDGIQGNTGAQGEQGIPGLFVRGEDGDDGAAGIPGTAGQAGVAGADGIAGANGYTIRGEDGTDGEQGLPGQAGASGAAGSTGADGLSVRGADGEDGVDGIHGATINYPGTTNVFLRGDGVFAAPPGGSGSAVTVETNISSARWTGKFTITDAAISAGSKVMCWQAPGPYTGKGTRADEAELAPVSVISVAPAAGSATVYWQTPPMISAQLFSQDHPKSATLTGDSLPVQRYFNQRLGKVRGNLKFSYMVFS